MGKTREELRSALKMNIMKRILLISVIMLCGCSQPHELKVDIYDISCKPKITRSASGPPFTKSQLSAIISLKDNRREACCITDLDWLDKIGISSSETYKFTIMPGFQVDEESFISDTIIAIHKEGKQIYRMNEKDLRELKSMFIEQKAKK